MLENRFAIEQAPLQIYNSALIFSPSQNGLRVDFENQLAPWINTIFPIPKNWSPLLRTLEGHFGRVNSIAYSPERQKLVSGSDDGTVRIWTAATGSLLQQLLEGSTDQVTSVAFSPDGQKLASALTNDWREDQGTSIKIWDAATGSPYGSGC